MSLVIETLTFSLCKKLVDRRMTEAKILLAKRKYSGAYYLGGYAVELALKACYCKKVKKGSFPPERAIYDKLYDHDLNKLLDVSGIKADFNSAVSSNSPLQTAWEVVKDWSEKSRYTIVKRGDSISLVQAIETVLNWIKTKW